QALTRFANNIIHQNVEEETEMLSVRAVVGQRTARATTNRFDDESIRRVVEEATAIAKLQAADPDLLPMAERAPQREIDRYDEATETATPGFRDEVVKRAVEIAERDSLTAAGIFATGAGVEAILNSRGVFAYH